MLNLDSEINISLFFKWWWQQLSFFVPRKFLDALAREKSLLVIEITAAIAKISFVNNQQETVLGEFEFNELAKEELQSLIANNKQYSDAKIVLRVPEQLSVTQDVFLPAAAESNLRQVMSYELDRYTPFKADQVYFDFIKLGPANNKALVHLLLVLVKKDSLESMYQHCLELGLQPFYADSAARVVGFDESANQYNLLPSDLCQKANKKPLFIMLGSAMVTLILIIILMILPISSATDQLNELKQRARKVEKVALEIEDSKKSIDYLFQATRALIDKKKAASSVIELMNKVTEVFGDDTWVSNWRYYDNTLQLTGQSGSASNLIASLEKTELFRNTKFISPVTKDNRSGLERFKISTEVIIKQHADAE
ncbi:hypothetical protein AU255_01955 [Methyloprofundus sedimenti]|uniref:Fimbrial assembly protein n=1 Tax=Methyloprofundus sedimenti TaxID=1420851 RepID=A0A1V8M570_9GAMM|nr:PilN domain-containing protein [Methyloprofundus sedimenti]OQK16694.1 hypothetical protein AU255_01955 [Methyloprofundus sedimenti]